MEKWSVDSSKVTEQRQTTHPRRSFTPYPNYVRHPTSQPGSVIGDRPGLSRTVSACVLVPAPHHHALLIRLQPLGYSNAKTSRLFVSFAVGCAQASPVGRYVCRPHCRRGRAFHREQEIRLTRRLYWIRKVVLSCVGRFDSILQSSINVPVTVVRTRRTALRGRCLVAAHIRRWKLEIGRTRVETRVQMKNTTLSGTAGSKRVTHVSTLPKPRCTAHCEERTGTKARTENRLEPRSGKHTRVRTFFVSVVGFIRVVGWSAARRPRPWTLVI